PGRPALAGGRGGVAGRLRVLRVVAVGPVDEDPDRVVMVDPGVVDGQRADRGLASRRGGLRGAGYLGDAVAERSAAETARREYAPAASLMSTPVTRERSSEPCASRNTTPAVASTPWASTVTPEMRTVIGSRTLPMAAMMTPRPLRMSGL